MLRTLMKPITAENMNLLSAVKTSRYTNLTPRYEPLMKPITAENMSLQRYRKERNLCVNLALSCSPR